MMVQRGSDDRYGAASRRAQRLSGGAVSVPALRRRHTPVPLLEDTTDEQRRALTAVALIRLRRGNAAEVWQLTLRDREGVIAAESLFTLPLAATEWEDAVDRAGSFLAAVDLTIGSNWEHVRPGHLRSTIHPLTPHTRG